MEHIYGATAALGNSWRTSCIVWKYYWHYISAVVRVFACTAHVARVGIVCNLFRAVVCCHSLVATAGTFSIDRCAAWQNVPLGLLVGKEWMYVHDLVAKVGEMPVRNFGPPCELRANVAPVCVCVCVCVVCSSIYDRSFIMMITWAIMCHAITCVCVCVCVSLCLCACSL